jgi:hypothetical protein
MLRSMKASTLFPKFVKEIAAMYHELRKAGTSAAFRKRKQIEDGVIAARIESPQDRSTTQQSLDIRIGAAVGLPARRSESDPKRVSLW